ncbi:MAG: hypothetical protein HOV96_34510 [Nonomuraea sp.]|nr:hypothetical protein [Nonomuraea sp.]NUP60769.1 hypothetical protein [Nonomuraea sp.]NUP82663.1 hypothetical protein [Nonomuraea sp.]NUS05663.1 hypothetical protein [Nonomuraea sp.]
MAALTAGVTWLAAGPSTADTCRTKEKGLLSPDSLASYCDGRTRVRLNEGETGGRRVVTEEANKLAMAAGEMARELGLTGLAAARSAMGPFADLGGIGASWGMPSVSHGSPAAFPVGPGGMQDLSTMVEVPALPALPALPQTPVAARLPAEMSLGQKLSPDRVASRAVRPPTDVQKPVNEIGSEVIANLLPQAVESVEDASLLPGGHPAIDGFGGLLRGLALN